MSELNAPKAPKPQFRNIHITDIMRYRLPITGKVSIMHRISGALMFLLLPFMLYLLEMSLDWEKFATLREFAVHPLVKLIILALAVSYIAHFCAGVRHLFMDVHWAADKEGASKSAWGVMAVTVVLSLLVALKLYGVF
ncbi:MAG TPA: succinate dehydrogenase, cytochrome b556 subunit [Burkholderiaceae bacterium]